MERKKTVVKSRLTQSIKIFPEKCTGCLICELRCAFRSKKSILLAASAIQVRRTGDGGFNISFSGECNNCGTCARNCMYGALVTEEG
jgi:ferredoxin